MIVIDGVTMVAVIVLVVRTCRGASTTLVLGSSVIIRDLDGCWMCALFLDRVLCLRKTNWKGWGCRSWPVKNVQQAAANRV